MNIVVQENSQYTLEFEEPAIPGTYEEITWYKGSTSSDETIVIYINGETLRYYDDYCSSSSRCSTSEKGELNTDTGGLTIKSVELSDDDYYYYRFLNPGSYDTGIKFEYNLDVYGESF